MDVPDLDAVRPEHLPRVEEEYRGRRRDWMPRSADARFLSFDRDGYEREEGVRQLARVRGGSELPFLLLRLTDWVPQVRDAALRAVLDRMTAEYVDAFARNFVLVERVLRSQRADHAAFIGPLTALLATSAGQAAMLAAVRSGSRAAAPAVRFLIERGGDRAMLLDAALAARDAMIRLQMVPFVADSLPALERLATDPAPFVRRAALQALARTFPANARPFLERAVLDTSASVREIARFALEGRDFAAVYRDAIAAATKTHALAAAISGLSEVGKAADAVAVESYLAHERAIVRRAAVKCVMRLSGDAAAERIAELLGDPSPAVSAAAREASRRHARLLGCFRLTTILAAATHPHTRLNVVHLLAALSKWESIIHLLGAVTGEDDDVASLALRYVAQWNRQYNRSHTTPSRRELQELHAALSAAEAKLDARDASEIRFALSSFGPPGS